MYILAFIIKYSKDIFTGIVRFTGQQCADYLFTVCIPSIEKTTPMHQKPERLPWLMPALAYAVAFILSAPFNSGLLEGKFISISLGWLPRGLAFIPAGLGTLIAALTFSRAGHGTLRTVTFAGQDKYKNMVIALVPVAVFSLTGIQSSRLGQEHVHLYSLFFGTVALLYATSEEIFWRGYLQDALHGISRNKAYILTGILWWAWHFRFSTVFDLTAFAGICIVSAILLGYFANATKSYFASAGLHALVIITTTGETFAGTKITGMVLTLLIWLAIGKWWKAGKTNPDVR